MGVSDDPNKLYSLQRRLLVSSNDCTVRIYRLMFTKVVSRNTTLIRVMEEACARYNTGINHGKYQTDIVLVVHSLLASVSPDGRLLLTAGDTPHLHLHNLPSSSFGTKDFSFVTEGQPTWKTRTQLDNRSYQPKPLFVIPTSGLNPSVDYWHGGMGGHSSQEAIFSTAFSADGLKLAAGSQDGVVQVRQLCHLHSGY